ncbi:protein-disulfide reductase DsbD family protein [Azospirillum rugosum]|uniref:Suppressor for copper-sensitivity B n=1 Tax=Azospirillum rugosum TaxID=416170 RepID=A0ABS4SHA0_9PROT|nr:protein-disulfide reductase DsbD domain-containing protein [Azospirillum rugosum]MBP2291946.1 suppressor for copper-sensitivity B [Azospirillum rugosum]MDQ0525918.1 suppressor for copper-sensitivity B [Azospirillum rugosum]
MKRLVPLLFAILALTTPGTGRAEGGAWTKAGPVEARLVSSVQGTGDLKTVPLGLELRLEPEWKTYWRSPGDAGFAPRLDWAGSANLARADIAYPAPQRFTVLGFETAGYHDEVLFPITAVPTEPGKPLDLSLNAEILVCSTICVPQAFKLDLSIPAGPAAPGPSANDIARAQSQVPGDGRASGLSITSVRAEGGALEVEVTARDPMVSPDLFVETDPPVSFPAPKRTFSDDDRRVRLRLDATDAPADLNLAGRAMTLTLVDGDRSMETAATAAAGLSGAASRGLAAMLSVALLGGLILNLMPCVLPVLSLKLLSIVQHGGRAPAAVRAGFLASAAGILVSFLALASALVAVKAAGGAVGWGIQFQQPLFLVFMVVLVTLFAANLWGLFEVPLPRAVADRLGGGEGGSLGGQFATGAFATLLATPCSAPFLGTAVGFALAGGPADVFAIFAALGIGLALPYLLVAAFPRVARLLPRPGRWMVALRRVLGAALALTAVWLLSVLVVQVGEVAAMAVAVLMGGLVAALWLARRLSPATRWTGAALAGLLAVVAFVIPAAFGPSAGAAPSAVTEASTRWTPFAESAIRDHVAAGKLVFVDVTADWCITCQANKKLVLHRGEVARRLEDAGLVAMRADWTRPDDGIARYLASHGRYGIPFNMVYGPGAPEGIALPELLTEGAVLEALDRARGRDGLAGGPARS